MRLTDHIPEEKLIDLTLGNIDGEEGKNIQDHLDECERCAKIAKQWGQLLEKGNLPSVHPSTTLKDKLWERVEQNRKPVKFGGRLKQSAAVFTFAAIFTLFFLLWNGRPGPDKPYEVAKNGEIPLDALHLKPNSKQLNIVPVMDHHPINGNIWINDDSKEMLLEVDGLPYYRDRDYQLWIIFSNDDVEGEILTLQDGSSRIFFQGIDVDGFKLIKASVEPKGGSLVQTGPDTFIVEFNH